MTPIRSRLLIALGVCGGIVACGGTGLTPVEPAIACPIAPAPVVSLDGSAQPVSFGAPSVTGGQAPLTTSCLPASGAAFTVGTTTVTCTTRDARERTASCTFPVVVQPAPKLAVTSFLAYGDSITWGEDGRDAAFADTEQQHIFIQLTDQTYPVVLQQELVSRYRQQSPSVVNDGLRGESLSDGLSLDCQGGPPNQSVAFQRYTSDITRGQYGGLLLMEGSNDVDASVGDSCLLGKAISVLRAIVEDAKGRGVRVVMATIPPMVPPGANNRARGYPNVPTYNDMVRSLATSEAVPLADVYAAFGSDTPSLIGFDGLHPNASGYQRIADTFFAAIKSSLETQTSAGAQSMTRRRGRP